MAANRGNCEHELAVIAEVRLIGESAEVEPVLEGPEIEYEADLLTQGTEIGEIGNEYSYVYKLPRNVVTCEEYELSG